MTPQIDDLSADELRLVLSVDPDELPEEEALAVAYFIERIGGRENAIDAVELLEKLEHPFR
jgi:hypothetical protein